MIHFSIESFLFSETENISKEDEFLPKISKNTTILDNNNLQNEALTNKTYGYFFQGILILLSLFFILIFFKNKFKIFESRQKFTSLKKRSPFHLASISISEEIHLEFIQILNKIYVILTYPKTAQLITMLDNSKELQDFLTMLSENSMSENYNFENRFKNFFNYYLKNFQKK